MTWRLGEGPAVLLVHGWEDDNALWGPMIDRLLANGRAVVALDLPGHGFSPAEMAGPASVAAAVAAVAQACGPIEAVIGHSFGCVALTAAIDGGMAVQRAVLIASPIPKLDLDLWVDRQTERGAPAVVAERAKGLLAKRRAAEGSPFSIEAAARCMTAQALIVHSMDDDQCPPENARILADAWPGAELMWTDGLGHRRVAQDQATTQRAADFIEGLPPRV